MPHHDLGAVELDLGLPEGDLGPADLLGRAVLLALLGLAQRLLGLDDGPLGLVELSHGLVELSHGVDEKLLLRGGVVVAAATGRVVLHRLSPGVGSADPVGDGDEVRGLVGLVGTQDDSVAVADDCRRLGAVGRIAVLDLDLGGVVPHVTLEREPVRRSALPHHVLARDVLDAARATRSGSGRHCAVGRQPEGQSNQEHEKSPHVGPSGR